MQGLRKRGGKVLLKWWYFPAHSLWSLYNVPLTVRQVRWAFDHMLPMWFLLSPTHRTWCANCSVPLSQFIYKDGYHTLTGINWCPYTFVFHIVLLANSWTGMRITIRWQETLLNKGRIVAFIRQTIFRMIPFCIHPLLIKELWRNII